MSYEYGFADNIAYGAEDINKLVRSLVSSGVSDGFENGRSYNAEDINGIVKTVCSDGVVPDSVDTLKVSKISNGKIAIASGLAFFADGSTIRVTSAHEMSYTQGVKNYVYLKQDLTEQNRSYPVCSENGPSGDYVLLAEIEPDGSVTDKRKYAQGKYPGYQSNANGTMVIEKDIQINEKSGSISFTIDMGTNNYSRVFVVADKYLSDEAFDGRMGVYSLTDGTYFCVSAHDDWAHSSTEHIIVGKGTGYAPDGKLTFSPNGNLLNCVLTWDSDRIRKYLFTMVLC